MAPRYAVVFGLMAVSTLGAQPERRAVAPSSQSAHQEVPSGFETFARQPTAQVVRSQLIGTLEGQVARAEVVVLDVEAPGGSPSEQVGVRIDLSHKVEKPSCLWTSLAWSTMCRRENAATYMSYTELYWMRRALLAGDAALPGCGQIARVDPSPPAATGLIVCGYQFEGVGTRELDSVLSLAEAALESWVNAPMADFPTPQVLEQIAALEKAFTVAIESELPLSGVAPWRRAEFRPGRNLFELAWRNRRPGEGPYLQVTAYLYPTAEAAREGLALYNFSLAMPARGCDWGLVPRPPIAPGESSARLADEECPFWHPGALLFRQGKAFVRLHTRLANVRGIVERLAHALDQLE